MYDIIRVRQEFIDACEGVGVKVQVPIMANGRLTRTLGRVHSERKAGEPWKATRVEFSKQLLETSTDETIRDVILHEAAHYVVVTRTGESHGHDAVFKAACAELGTTNDGTTTKVESTVAATALYKYTIDCPRCGNIGGMNRMCKTLREINWCTCRKCGGAGLTYTQNW